MFRDEFGRTYSKVLCSNGPGFAGTLWREIIPTELVKEYKFRVPRTYDQDPIDLRIDQTEAVAAQIVAKRHGYNEVAHYHPHWGWGVGDGSLPKTEIAEVKAQLEAQFDPAYKVPREAR